MTSTPVDQAAMPGQPAREFPAIAGATPFSTATLRWSVLPWAVARTPGFPAKLIARLAEPRLTDASDRLAALRSAAVSSRSRLIDAIAAARSGADHATLLQLRKMERAACHDRVVAPGPPAAGSAVAVSAADWNSGRAAIESAQTDLAAAYDTAYSEAMTQVARECASPRFAHALFISSRDFFDHAWQDGLDSAPPDAPLDKSRRKALRTSARYLRRLTVRCEQTSFFGPVHFVDLDPAEPGALATGSPLPERVYAEPSMWLLERLTRYAERGTPELDRPTRPHPLFRVRENRLIRTTDGRSRRLSDDAARVWDELPEHGCVGAAATALGLPADRAASSLAELRPALMPWQRPAHELYPFEQLLALDPDPVVRRIGEYRDAFAAGRWPERREAFLAIERLVSQEFQADTAVGQGRHYADRYVLHEERAHPLSARTTLGARVVGPLQTATEAMLPLAYAGALLRRADARAELRAALAGRRLPLAAAVALEIPDRTPRFSAFLAAANALAASRVTAGVVQLTRADIAGLIDRHCAGLDPDDAYATVAGPDWMLMAPLENATWVLGELHDDGSYLAGAVTRVHPDGAALRAEFERRLVEVVDPDEMAAIVARRRNKFLIPEMPGVAIEVGAGSVKPRSQAVPIADVEVAEDGAAVLVRGRRLRLYSGDIPSAVHRALAVPALNPVTFDFGCGTPRIVIDGTVLQRARWRMDLPGGVHGYQAWESAQELRREWGLPRRVFVRHPREPKPLFVDFADVLSVEDVMRLPPAPVVLSEMLPDLGDLWWRPDGELLCAELRTACFAGLDFTGADGGAPAAAGVRA